MNKKNLTRISLFALLLVSPVLFFSFNAGEAAGEKKEDKAINWLSFEEAVKLNEKKPKKIFIDVYTDWCGWCKRLDATTFKDSAVIKYMNKNFYAVKLNAEKCDTVRFQDKVFACRPGSRTNDLALSLFDGKISGYPSAVYLDEKLSRIYIYPGYVDGRSLEAFLKYIAEDTYKTHTWDQYLKSHQKN